jgi:aldehyde:ferredoxin oxidoreductase
MTVKRAFNIRCGITASDDRLPEVFTKPFAAGSNEGKAPDLKMQLQQFYETSQWDPKTGKPTFNLLMDLGLPDVAKDLWPDSS